MANMRQACFATAGYRMGCGSPRTGVFLCHTLDLGSFYLPPGRPFQGSRCSLTSRHAYDADVVVIVVIDDDALPAACCIKT
jgi:hypothetical protein